MKERKRKAEKNTMAASNALLGAMAIIALIFAVMLPTARAEFPSPAPAPTSDGVYNFPFFIRRNNLKRKKEKPD